MLRRGKNDPNLDSFRANLPGKMPKISWEGNVALNSSVPAVPQLPVQRVPIPVPNWAAQGGRLRRELVKCLFQPCPTCGEADSRTRVKQVPKVRVEKSKH